MADKDVQTDALDDALASGGAEVLEHKLPTPAEMEALEDKAAAASEGKPVAKEDEKEAEDQQGIDLDLLNEKVEKGEELSEAEQARLDELQSTVEKNEKAVRPDKKYTVDKKEFTFAEKEAEMRKDLEIPDDEEIPPARLEKMVDTFVKAQNREAQHVQTSERAKQVAEDRKKNEAEETRLRDVRSTIDRERGAVESARSAIEEEKATLRETRDELESAANSPITEDETVNSETGLTNVKKLMEYQEKLRAQKALEKLEKREKALSDKEGKITEKEDDIAALHIHTWITSLQLAHPQYRTSEDIRVIARKLNVTHEHVSEEDEEKALALFSMMNEASTGRTTLEKVFASRKRQGMIIPEVAQSTAPAVNRPPKSNESVKQQIAALRAKIKRNPSLAGPSGGGQRGNGKLRPAQVLVAEERAAREEDTGSTRFNPFA